MKNPLIALGGIVAALIYLMVAKSKNWFPFKKVTFSESPNVPQTAKQQLATIFTGSNIKNFGTDTDWQNITWTSDVDTDIKQFINYLELQKANYPNNFDADQLLTDLKTNNYDTILADFKKMSL